VVRSTKPIAEKDLKVYDVEDYPYMVTKPDERAVGGPWFHRSHKKAIASLVNELVGLREMFERLNATDSVSRIGRLIDEVSSLPLEGGRVAGVVDTYSGVKYQAELVKREAV
jgi:hypothetical protein